MEQIKAKASLTADNFVTLQIHEDGVIGHMGTSEVKLNRGEAIQLARDLDKLARMLPQGRR